MKRIVFPIAMASLGLISIVTGPSTLGQDHQHGEHHNHGADADAAQTGIRPPTVFLDKSPRIVEYQLKRLDNQRLLMVDRKTDDPKYIPVYQAILGRVGMSPQYREEAIDALVKLTGNRRTRILADAIEKFDPDNADERRAARQLTELLLRQSPSELKADLEILSASFESDNPLLRATAVAAVVLAGRTDIAVQRLQDDATAPDVLAAIELIPNDAMRSPLRDPIVEIVKSDRPLALRRKAITALGYIPHDQQDTFQLVAPLVANPQLRNAAVRTLLRIPKDQRDRAAGAALLDELVKIAETTPAEDRTSDAFIDAMQLADELMSVVPPALARSYRQRLDAVTVRVIRIRTVEEEMRYDTPYFAVQAGKPVQIILENHDLMPHNLVITVPGALKEVALLGLQAGPNNGWKGLQYVPKSEKVLHATQMVPPGQQARLTFTAPETPGEYPYVCTFPQHWYRMYGVMVVVDDLDAWLQNPVEPANPIGSNRSFVKQWTVEDLKDELDEGMRGRSPEIGKKIFVEASCAGCHKFAGEGGVIGPDLTDVFKRWKGDRIGVLTEILDPSHKVDPKYAMQRVLTFDGRTVTGLLQKEDDDNIYLVISPEAKEPIVIPKDDIDVMIPSDTSMMPKALLDQYTKDEIMELMAFLESGSPSP